MTLNKQDSVIWLDGDFVPWKDAKVHVLTHTLHYGAGVFEGLRAYKTEKGSAIFRLDDHTDRLFRSAHILGMKIPFSKEIINKACLEGVQKNDLQSAYIRPMCFYGANGMGLRADNLTVHVMVAACYWDNFWDEKVTYNGLRVRTSSYARHHSNTTMCKAKANGNYLNSILALREAIDCGYDEALLLDSEGFVAEGSGENVFIARNGILYTPDTTSALEGITRDTIFTLAKELKLNIKEKRITRDEVYIADEAFFTGTAAEVTFIRELDGRMIGNGQCGTISKQLQQMYFDQVHDRRTQNPEWLSYI